MTASKQPLNFAAIAALAAGDIDNFRVAATPGGIEAQEAEGQATMIASSKLPKKMTGATRAQLEAIGFVFGADADDLFVNVTLPTGWRIQATEHSMHSDLLDASGACRASIFYKAAFYDRNADIHFTSRYVVRQICVDPGDQCLAAAYDEKTGERLLELAPRPRNDYHGLVADAAVCAKFIDERFPDRRNAMAYWEQQP